MLFNVLVNLINFVYVNSKITQLCVALVLAITTLVGIYSLFVHSNAEDIVVSH